MSDYCDYKNHPISEHGDYVIYSDSIRGLKDVKMCKHCYGLYLLMYYPRSRLAGYVRNNLQEYHIAMEEREEIEMELAND